MTDEQLCPIVGSYIRAVREHWGDSEQWGPHRIHAQLAGSAYQDFLDRLTELEEYALTLPWNMEVQRLRAFHCLHNLFLALRSRLAVPESRLPLTREGIQSLIEFCYKTRDDLEVNTYYIDLAKHDRVGTQALNRANVERVIKLTHTVIEVGEFLRPRLRNGESLGPIGKLYLQGFLAIYAPPEKLVKLCHDLIQVTPVTYVG